MVRRPVAAEILTALAKLDEALSPVEQHLFDKSTKHIENYVAHTAHIGEKGHAEVLSTAGVSVLSVVSGRVG